MPMMSPSVTNWTLAQINWCQSFVNTRAMVAAGITQTRFSAVRDSLSCRRV